MLTAQIEAVLFAAGKPVAVRQLARVLGASEEVVGEALAELRSRLNREDTPIHLLEHEGKAQLATNPSLAPLVRAFAKEEASGELTRPSLETLTIVAYRGPLTKPEIEQIRGVNCSLILRNLLVRGLIEEREDKERLQPVYAVSPDLLRHLGIHRIDELPSYGDFHGNERIDRMLAELGQAASVESPS